AGRPAHGQRRARPGRRRRAAAARARSAARGRAPRAHADLRGAGPDGAGAEAVPALPRGAAQRAWRAAGGRDGAPLPLDPGKADGGAAGAWAWLIGRGCWWSKAPAPHSTPRTRTTGAHFGRETLRFAAAPSQPAPRPR